MIINIILILVIVIGGIFGIRYFVSKVAEKEKMEGGASEDVEDIMALNYLIDEVSNAITADLKRRIDNKNLTREQVMVQKRATNTLRTNITQASYGDPNAKRAVKDRIISIISDDKYNIVDNFDKIIPFETHWKISSQDKFEIILYLYNKECESRGGEFLRSGLSKMIDDYNLKRMVYDGPRGEGRYAITKDRIDYIYNDIIVKQNNEFIGKVELDTYDKLNIIAQKIYEKYLGFGAIDMLYETDIDEIDCGVSGIPENLFTAKSNSEETPSYSYESIWIVYRGVNIKMECLSFETQRELVRVCENIYTYDAPYVMSRSEGRVVSTMRDGSRIVVCRPPFAESYSFFLRKFDSAPGSTLQDRIAEGNKFLPICLSKWIIKGQRNTGVTGSQGTGKTTMLKALIRYIDPSFNLRIQELQFELNLRFAYPNRNIVTFQETANISAQEGLNLQKKTNGAVNIIGEVATAVQASHIIQTAMVASLFAMFTHHAKTSKDFVNAIADNLLQIGLYKEKTDAVRVTSEILNIDIHLTNIKGHRYIERITEIIPLKDRPYPSDSLVEKANLSALTAAQTKSINMTEKELSEAYSKIKFAENLDAMEYYRRETDPELFITKDLIRWVPVTDDNNGKIKGKFIVENIMSDEMQKDIISKLSADEEKLFMRDIDMMRKMKNKEIDETSDEFIQWVNEVENY